MTKKPYVLSSCSREEEGKESSRFFVSILARNFYLLRIEEKVAEMKRRING
jgi:hypothetical protein